MALVAIYLAFLAKHLVCDYFLQTVWMVRGKERRAGWLAPLAAHAGIHAAGTLLIVLAIAPALWWLAAVDFLLHALVDRAKAILTRGTDPGRPLFWWLFGTDQALHQLTHFGFVLVLLYA